MCPQRSTSLTRASATFSRSGRPRWRRALITALLLACGSEDAPPGVAMTPEGVSPARMDPGFASARQAGGDEGQGPGAEATMGADVQRTEEGPADALPRDADGSGDGAPPSSEATPAAEATPAGQGMPPGDADEPSDDAAGDPDEATDAPDGANDTGEATDDPQDVTNDPDEGTNGPEEGAGEPEVSPDTDADDLPLLRVPVRVHLGGDAELLPSELTGTELGAIFEEMNSIWQSQARLCFEFETTEGIETRRGEGLPGFDLWFSSNLAGSNGVYRGRRDRAFSDDQPGLGARGVDDPAQIPAARTAAHELGHGLGLAHSNCRDGEAAPPLDACREFLMASGTRGTLLIDGVRDFDGVEKNEISIARSRAQNPNLALPDTSLDACAAPVISRD